MMGFIMAFLPLILIFIPITLLSPPTPADPPFYIYGFAIRVAKVRAFYKAWAS